MNILFVLCLSRIVFGNSQDDSSSSGIEPSPDTYTVTDSCPSQWWDEYGNCVDDGYDYWCPSQWWDEYGNCVDDDDNANIFFALLFLASFLPFKIILLTMGMPGAGCNGAFGTDSCCYNSNPAACCTSGCWSTANMTFAVINCMVDLISLLFLIEYSAMIGWWICWIILLTFTWIHFTLSRALNKVRSPQTAAFNGLQAIPIQQHYNPQGIVHGGSNQHRGASMILPSQAVPHYCQSCGGIYIYNSCYYNHIRDFFIFHINFIIYIYIYIYM